MLGSIGDKVDANVSLVYKHDLKILSLTAEENRGVVADPYRANPKEPATSGATERLQKLKACPNGLRPSWYSRILKDKFVVKLSKFD